MAINGAALGSGVYFSDCFSKALEFAPTTGRKRYVFAATVALGNIHILHANVDAETFVPPFNTNSIWGHWLKNIIDALHPTTYETFGGLSVPTGVLEQRDHETALEHNEFIALDENKIDDTLYIFECENLIL